MNRTLDTLLVALLAAECGPLKCPVARLQHAVSRVETLLRDEFGFSETAKELRGLREGIDVQPEPVQQPSTYSLAGQAEPDVLTGRRKRRQSVTESK